MFRKTCSRMAGVRFPVTEYIFYNFYDFFKRILILLLMCYCCVYYLLQSSLLSISSSPWAIGQSISCLFAWPVLRWGLKP